VCMATYCVSSNLCHFRGRGRGRGEGRVGEGRGAIAERGREGGMGDERGGWAVWVSE